MKTALASIVLAIICANYVKSAAVESTVTISQGRLTGKVFSTRAGRHGLSFLGIPYAKTPLRFKAAEAPSNWNGVRDASKFGSICTQYNRQDKQVVGSEDCLFLNVHTPLFPKNSVITKTDGKLLPVMVYIHGGSFLFQSGNNYAPKYILDEDVVLVTFNYRLGVFGFLNTGDKEVTPNVGMKDQVLALKWVKENIGKFGGDSSKVTIFGNSAGAAAVSYHMLSPMSKGLFARAIAQSGSVFSPWALVRRPELVANKFGTLVGCSTKTTKELVSCLKTKDVKEMAEKQQKLLGWSQDPSTPYAPSVETAETTSSNEANFLPDFPGDLLRQGKFNQVPLLTGVNSLDGLGLALAAIINSTKGLEQFDRGWDKIAPLAFGYSDTAPNPELISTKIRDYYFGSKNISDGTKADLVNAMSDRHFFRPTKNSAIFIAKTNPVYLYYFTFEGDSSVLGELGPKNLGLKGVAHVDDLQYIFPLKSAREITQGSKYVDFSTKLIKLWVSFATDGKPTKTWGKATNWQPVQSTEVTKDAPLNWYNIDTDTKLIEEPFSARLQFWSGLPLAPTNAKSGSSSTQKPQAKPANRPSSVAKPTPATVTVTPTVHAASPITLPTADPNVTNATTTTTTTTKKPGFFSKIIGK